MGSRPFDGGDDLVTRPRPWMFVRVDRVLFIGAPIRTEAAWYSKTPTSNFSNIRIRRKGSTAPVGLVPMPCARDRLGCAVTSPACSLALDILYNN